MNLKDGNISFQVNDDEKQIIWSDIEIGEEIKYKFAVVLYEDQTKITLTDFHQKLAK